MDRSEGLTPSQTGTESTRETQRQIASELDEYLYVHEQRRRTMPRAILVGFLAGAVAVAFGLGINYLNIFRLAMIGWAQQFWFGWIFPVAFTAIFTVSSLA